MELSSMKAEIGRYVVEKRELIGSLQNRSEQNVRAKLLDPLLKILGWDVEGREVECGLTIKKGPRPEFCDYALLHNGKPKIIIDAKKLDESVGDQRAVEQVRGYCRQTKSRFGVLCNGRELALYDDEAEKMVFTVPLECYASEFEGVLFYLTREKVADGTLDREITNIRSRGLQKAAPMELAMYEPPEQGTETDDQWATPERLLPCFILVLGSAEGEMHYRDRKSIDSKVEQMVKDKLRPGDLKKTKLDRPLWKNKLDWAKGALAEGKGLIEPLPKDKNGKKKQRDKWKLTSKGQEEYQRLKKAYST